MKLGNVVVTKKGKDDEYGDNDPYTIDSYSIESNYGLLGVVVGVGSILIEVLISEDEDIIPFYPFELETIGEL